jgi:hypothetical protein
MESTTNTITKKILTQVRKLAFCDLDKDIEKPTVDNARESLKECKQDILQ